MHIRVRALIAAIAVALAGWGGSNANEWLAEGSDGVAFLQWTRTDDSVTGTLAIAHREFSAGEEQPRYEVEAESISFTGVIDGSSVTLTLEQGFGFTTNWNGRR